MVIGLLNNPPVFGRGLGSLQRGETLLRLAGTLGERALQTLRRRVSRRELARPQHFLLAKKLDFSVLKPMERRSFFLEGCCLKHTVVGKTSGRILVIFFTQAIMVGCVGLCRSRVDHFNFVKYIIRSTWGWLYILYNMYVIYHYIPTFCQVCLSKQHTIHGGNLTPRRSSKEGVLNHNFGSIGRSQVWKISPWPLSRYHRNKKTNSVLIHGEKPWQRRDSQGHVADKCSGADLLVWEVH